MKRKIELWKVLLIIMILSAANAFFYYRVQHRIKIFKSDVENLAQLDREMVKKDLIIRKYVFEDPMLMKKFNEVWDSLEVKYGKDLKNVDVKKISGKKLKELLEANPSQ